MQQSYPSKTSAQSAQTSQFETLKHYHVIDPKLESQDKFIDMIKGKYNLTSKAGSPRAEQANSGLTTNMELSSRFREPEILTSNLPHSPKSRSPRGFVNH